MGMHAGAAATGGTRRRRRRGKGAGPIADINMTPFIDVMLVLLIIFMVTAPLLTAGVPLDLPKTGAGQLNIDRKPLTVSIDAKGQIFIGETQVALVEIVPKLQGVAKDGFDERIYVRGDRAAPYGDIMRVMSAITTAGYKRVAMLTEQERR
jgi:biopolymer transport protein TolR